MTDQMTPAERLRAAVTRLRYPYRGSRRYDEPLADWLDVTADVHEAGYHDAPPAALAVADAVLGSEQP